MRALKKRFKRHINFLVYLGIDIMTRGHVTCRPSGAVVTTIDYPCGECATFLLKPGSKQGEIVKRLHARACKICAGQQGMLAETHMPTKVGNTTQASKAMTRELLSSGSKARISTTLGKKQTPAVHAFNQIQISRSAEAELLAQMEVVLDNTTVAVNSEAVAHGVPRDIVVVSAA